MCMEFIENAVEEIPKLELLARVTSVLIRHQFGYFDRDLVKPQGLMTVLRYSLQYMRSIVRYLQLLVD